MRTLIQGLAGVICLAQCAACGFPRPAEVGPGDAASGLDAASSDDAGTLPDATPHMPYLEPRYLPDICDAVATMPDFTVSNTASLDTGLDSACNGGVVTQDSGPDICVLRYGSIHITSAGTFSLKGVRALALVADSEVSIDGVLDVSGDTAGTGPGGGTVVSGQAGGGAGFATAGGAGGTTTTDGGGGTGGGQATDPSLLTVLVGGTRPPPGGGSLGMPFPGGAGGAATLIACRGQVSVSGTIDAGGSGGQGGKAGIALGSVFGGAGGGSGGNVVLQGMSIVVTGQVFANGGAGGSGATSQGQPGQQGSNGTRSATNAAAGGDRSRWWRQRRRGWTPRRGSYRGSAPHSVGRHCRRRRRQYGLLPDLHARGCGANADADSRVA